MWFLYMIVWLYAITPLLRLFVNHANLRYVKYFILLGILMVFSRPIISVIEYYAPFNTSFLAWLDSFHADFVGGFTVYYLTGWYLHNYRLSVHMRKAIYFVSIISIITVITLVGVLPRSLFEIANSNESILIYLYSCGVYLWLQKAVFQKWLGSLAPFVFCIYIIHPIFIFLFNECFEYANTTIVYMIKWFVVCILSIGVAAMFSRVRYLRQIVKA